jgi:hypothetical protein
MFEVKFYKNEKLIGTEEFPTVDKAENELDNSELYNRGDYYEVVEKATGEIISENEIVDPDDIINDMFDDEESKEGFDWTLGD